MTTFIILHSEYNAQGDFHRAPTAGIASANFQTIQTLRKGSISAPIKLNTVTLSTCSTKVGQKPTSFVHQIFDIIITLSNYDVIITFSNHGAARHTFQRHIRIQ